MNVIAERLRGLVRALRSGKYRQTTGRLRDFGLGYCVMGVACQEYQKETGGPIDWAVGTAPEAVEVYFGLSNYDQEQFIKMNDTRTATFSKFANILAAKADELDPPAKPEEIKVEPLASESLMQEIKDKQKEKQLV